MREKLVKGDGVPYTQVANEVLADPGLSFKAKGIYAYLYSKPDDWQFSAARIAQESKDERKAVLAGLKELEDAGLLTRDRKVSGRVEYTIWSNPKSQKGTVVQQSEETSEPKSQNGTVPKQHRAETGLISNKDTHSNKDAYTNPSTDVEVASPIAYGREDINWVIETFKHRFGFTSQGRGKFDRICAKHLLNNFNREQIEGMMVYCTTDQFAPRVGSVEKLWYKRGDIIAGIKSRQQKSKSIVGTA